MFQDDYTSKRNRPKTQRKRDQICGNQRWGWDEEDWMKVVKKYKLPVTRQISTTDIITTW